MHLAAPFHTVIREGRKARATEGMKAINGSVVMEMYQSQKVVEGRERQRVRSGSKWKRLWENLASLRLESDCLPLSHELYSHLHYPSPIHPLLVTICLFPDAVPSGNSPPRAGHSRRVSSSLFIHCLFITLTPSLSTYLFHGLFYPSASQTFSDHSTLEDVSASL